MTQKNKRSGLGYRAMTEPEADKYLRGVLGESAGPPPVSGAGAKPAPDLNDAGAVSRKRSTGRKVAAALSAPGLDKAESRAIWDQPREEAGLEAGGRMVPKTWHLPEDLARRFDCFVVTKCPPGTRGVKVVRQILDDFLKDHGF